MYFKWFLSCCLWRTSQILFDCSEEYNIYFFQIIKRVLAAFIQKLKFFPWFFLSGKQSSSILRSTVFNTFFRRLEKTKCFPKKSIVWCCGMICMHLSISTIDKGAHQTNKKSSKESSLFILDLRPRNCS